MSWPVRHLPGRVRRGRPLRLLARALVAAALALAALHLVAGQPAAPALVTGVITWFLVTARADLAPPPETATALAGAPAGPPRLSAAHCQQVPFMYEMKGTLPSTQCPQDPGPQAPGS